MEATELDLESGTYPTLKLPFVKGIRLAKRKSRVGPDYRASKAAVRVFVDLEIPVALASPSLPKHFSESRRREFVHEAVAALGVIA
jgi:hypothetical protein